MAKPIRQAPALSFGTNSRMTSIRISSMVMSSKPTLMPDWSGSFTTGHGLPCKEANDVRQLAHVLMRMPNHATAYEPPIPKIVHNRMSRMRLTGMEFKPPK